jgi:hypothetical protein
MRGIYTKPWTDKEVQQLRELSDAHLTKRAIAEQLGRTLDSVGGKLHKLGLVSNPAAFRERGRAACSSPGHGRWHSARGR